MNGRPLYKLSVFYNVIYCYHCSRILFPPQRRFAKFSQMLLIDTNTINSTFTNSFFLTLLAVIRSGSRERVAIKQSGGARGLP